MAFKKVVEKKEEPKVEKTYADKKGIAVDGIGGATLNRPEAKGDNINKEHPSLKV